MVDNIRSERGLAVVLDWSSKTFADALRWGVATHDDREAVVHGSLRLTYRDLGTRADDFGSGLLKAGIRPGDRVGVWLPDCVEWLVARWAITSIGAILVPVNTRFRDADLGYVLKQSGCSALVMTGRFKKADYLGILRSLVPDVDSQNPGGLHFDALPDLKLLIGVGADILPSMTPFEIIEEQGKSWHSRDNALGQARAGLKATDIAQILFTSGTTSFPKGAMVRHGALLQNNFNTIARMRLTAVDRYLATSPLFSATGTSFTLSPFLAGGCQVLMDGFSADDFCAIVEAERITQSFFVEPMVHDLRAHPSLGRYKLDTLRTGTGAPLTRESFRWLVEDVGVSDLTNVYGLSETSNAVCRTFCDEPLTHRIESSGPPMPNVSLRIDDLESGESLGPGQVGEIRVKGYTVMAGYFRMPDETAKTIDPDGWLHTGDLGELTADGRLIFRGRVKEMIKPGGFNVATLEIEDFIKTFPGVKEAVVVGVPDPRQVEVALAYIEAKPGAVLDPAEIIAYCRKHIASYKVPRGIRFVNEWPLTPTGKLRKLELKERAALEAGKI